MKSIGQNIAKFRKEKSITQEELALRRQRESGEEKTIAPNLEETPTTQETEE